MPCYCARSSCEMKMGVKKVDCVRETGGEKGVYILQLEPVSTVSHQRGAQVSNCLLRQSDKRMCLTRGNRAIEQRKWMSFFPTLR